MTKIDCLNFKEISEQLKGYEKYRAFQIYDWIYKKGVFDFEKMTNLPKQIKDELGIILEFTKIDVEKIDVSEMDGSVKFLLRLEDGNFVESVILPDKDRLTACLSTQVGCRMGCRFCNTASIGFVRDLSIAEIIRQFYILNDYLLENNQKLTNIVFMGMGEPLDNYDNFKKAVEIMSDQDGLCFSHRRMTFSTCGLVDKLERFFAEDNKINIAVSLNAVDDKIRSKLMPINNKFNIGQLMTALRKLPIQKRKRITIEYVMFKGINDSKNNASDLVRMVRGIPVKINLIVYNGTVNSGYYAPDMETVLKFQQILIDNKLTAFIRKSFGKDINGACGQLAAGYKQRYDRGEICQ